MIFSYYFVLNWDHLSMFRLVITIAVFLWRVVIIPRFLRCWLLIKFITFLQFWRRMQFLKWRFILSELFSYFFQTVAKNIKYIEVFIIFCDHGYGGWHILEYTSICFCICWSKFGDSMKTIPKGWSASKHSRQMTFYMFLKCWTINKLNCKKYTHEKTESSYNNR